MKVLWLVKLVDRSKVRYPRNDLHLTSINYLDKKVLDLVDTHICIRTQRGWNLIQVYLRKRNVGELTSIPTKKCLLINAIIGNKAIKSMIEF